MRALWRKVRGNHADAQGLKLWRGRPHAHQVVQKEARILRFLKAAFVEVMTEILHPFDFETETPAVKSVCAQALSRTHIRADAANILQFQMQDRVRQWSREYSLFSRRKNPVKMGVVWKRGCSRNAEFPAPPVRRCFSCARARLPSTPQRPILRLPVK